MWWSTFIALALALEQPQIISLDPSMTEILYELDLGEQVVGRDSRSNHPTAAKKISVTSNHLKLNREKILQLQANWILGHDIGFSDLEPFAQKYNIRYQLLKNDSYASLKENILKIGGWLDQNTLAQEVVSKLPKFRPIIAQKNFVILIDSLSRIAVGKDTYLSKAFEACGLKNALPQNGYPKLDRETIETLDVDFLFLLSNESEIQVSNKKAISLAPDIFSRFTPRFYRAAWAKCQDLAKDSPTSDSK